VFSQHSLQKQQLLLLLFYVLCYVCWPPQNTVRRDSFRKQDLGIARRATPLSASLHVHKTELTQNAAGGVTQGKK
jgi:hypothetical protein